MSFLRTRACSVPTAGVERRSNDSGRGDSSSRWPASHARALVLSRTTCCAIPPRTSTESTSRRGVTSGSASRFGVHWFDGELPATKPAACDDVVGEAIAATFAVVFGVLAFRDARQGLPQSTFVRHRNGAFGLAAWAIVIAARWVTHAY